MPRQIIGNNTNTLFSNPALATIEDVSLGYYQNQDYETATNENVDFAGKFDVGPAKNTILLYGTTLHNNTTDLEYTGNYPASSVLLVGDPRFNQRPHARPASSSPKTSTPSRPNILLVHRRIFPFNDVLNLAAAIREDHQNQTTYNYVSASNIYGDIRNGTTRKIGVVLRPVEPLSLFYNYSQTFAPNGFGVGVTGASYKLPNLDSNISEGGAKLGLLTID